MTTAAVQSRWLHALTMACERNTPIDVSPTEATDDQRHVVVRGENSFESADRPTWRVRLLRVEGLSVVIERPMVGRTPVSVRPGSTLTGVLMQGETRWSFDTRVIEPIRVTLADDVEVLGVRLSMPLHVHIAQRRDYFRVDVAAVVVEPAKIAVLTEPAEAAAYLQHNRTAHRLAGRGAESLVAPPAPRCGGAFTGRTVDLSGGGLCVSVDLAVEPMLVTLPALWVELHLPDTPEPIFAVTRVTHWRHEGDRMLVGLSFTCEQDREHGAFLADAICRFTAEQQRRRLQRQA